MPRAVKKSAEAPPVEITEDLQLLLELVDEQKKAMAAKALASPDRMNAFYIAKGDHLVLLVSRAPGAPGPAQTVYLCNLVEVRTTP